MAHTTIAQRDLDAARSLLTQLLKDNLPDLDWNELSVFHDTLIKGAAYVVALVFAENRKVRDLTNPTYLAQNDDEEAREAAELLFSRFFHQREPGKRSRGVARIYLSGAEDFPINTRVRLTRDGRRFHADVAEPYFIHGVDLNANFNEDGEPVEYYFDLPVIADQPGDVTFTEGSFNSWDNLPVDTFRAIIVEPITGGGPAESNASYVASADQAVHKSSFSSDRLGIFRHIRRRFPAAVNHVRVFGAGDPEMRRDWVEAFQSHVLGHTDIYCFQDLTPQPQNALSVELASEGATTGGESTFLRARLPQVPTHRIAVDGMTRVHPPYAEGELDEALLGIDEFFVKSDPLTDGSLQQEKYIYLHKDADVEGSVQVSYYAPVTFTAIAEEARSPEYRDPSSDVLVRAPHVITLATTIQYHTTDNRARRQVSEARKGLVDFINNASDPIDHTDVAHYLKTNFPLLVKSVNSPFDIECRLHLPNGDFYDYATPSSVELDFDSVAGVEDLGVTPRTVQYITTYDDITLVEV